MIPPPPSSTRTYTLFPYTTLCRSTEYRLDTGQRRQAVAQRARIGKRCRRDLRQTVRSEQRHVDRRRRHQQTLIRADVRLGLGATDVLLARLQRQRVAGLAVEIDGAADDAARHLARSDERRLGKACVSPCSSRWSP